MKKKVLFGLAVVVFFFASGTSRGSLITNGDFETGDSAGWIFSGSVSVSSDSDMRTFADGVGTFPTGMFAVSFGAGNHTTSGVIIQDFSALSNHEYELSFNYGRFMDGSGGPQSIRVELINIADNQHLLDTVVTDSSGEKDLSILFSEYNYRFVALSSSTRLYISDVSAGTFDTDGILDNVGITPVPVPGTILLFASGLIGLAGFRRRKIL